MKIEALTSQAAIRNTELLIQDFLGHLRMSSMLSSIHVVKMKGDIEAGMRQN